MGNICCPTGESDVTHHHSGGDGGGRRGSKNTKAFTGAGNRLGNTNAPSASYGTGGPAPVALPDPIVDPKLSQTDRDKIRMERAQAAEKRLKSMGGDTGTGKNKNKNKKKPKDNTLKGPNSEPLMRWS